MAWGANVRNCERIQNYEAADYLFKTPLKTRSKKWKENQRPLDGISKPHFRVEKHDGYYDVVLYSTSMARFYKPELINGCERREVQYNVDERQTSTYFMYRVLGVGAYSKQFATTGREVIVGFNKHATGDFPIRLTYKNGMLDVASSVDAPNEKEPTTSDARKKARIAFKKWLKPFIAMAMMETRASTWFDSLFVKRSYEAGELIDPTDLVECIKGKGVAWVVNQVYPLGDVRSWDKSFVEVT